MTIATRLFVQGIPYTLLPSGVQYADPLHVTTYAAVRAMTVNPPIIQVGGRLSVGDGAGGTFLWDTSVASDDDGVKLVTHVTGGGYRRIFAGALQGAWYGVTANGLQITDGVRTSGNARLVSASAKFTAAMVGRTVLIREPDPTRLAAGTIAIAGGGSPIAQGAGTNVLVDLPPISGSDPNAYQPREGGAIYTNGSYYAALYGNNALQQLTLFQTTPTQTAHAWYTEVQRLATVTAYVSPTEVTLSITASVDQTAVMATIGTSDTTAIRATVNAAGPLGVRDIEMPSGLSCIDDNIGFTGLSDVTITWQRGSALVDIRKTSTEYTYPRADQYYGALSFVNCSRIKLVHPSYDANVPLLGVVHSAGGSINNSGAREGFNILNSTDCSLEYPQSSGLGARDEHVYWNAGCTNFKCLLPNIVGNNNVSLNMNGAVGDPNGTDIVGGIVNSILLGGGTFRIDGTQITSNNHARLSGGITISPIGHGVVSVTIRDINMLTAGTPAIDIFGQEVSDSSLKVRAKIINVNGLWASGQGAVARVANNGGTIDLELDVDRCTAAAPGGRFVAIQAPVTGKTNIRGTLRGRAGSNMTIGVELEAGTADSNVTIDPGLVYGESITTRVKLAQKLGAKDELLTISATGATLLTAATDIAIVTANGAVTATLFDPTKVKGKTVVVKNDTTQAGTTTVGTAAGNIDGVATKSLVGASVFGRYYSDGTNWKVVG